MANPVVVMITVSDRVKYINAFLETMAQFAPEIPIHIHIQDPEKRQSEIVVPKPLQVVRWMVSDEPQGCHAARINSLRDLAGDGFDTYVNVDDDVLLTPTTHWWPAIEYVAAHEDVGFVLTNWVRNSGLYIKMLPMIRHLVETRVLVYNGGGMAYNENVADMMRDLDPVPARYDDMWPLTTYVNGLVNGVYYGSLTVHQTVSKGGMMRYMATEPRPLLGWKYVEYPRLKTTRIGSEYAIGVDKDLKAIAHAEHRAARLAKGWLMNSKGTKGAMYPIDPSLRPEGVPA